MPVVFHALAENRWWQVRGDELAGLKGVAIIPGGKWDAIAFQRSPHAEGENCLGASLVRSYADLGSYDLRSLDALNQPVCATQRTALRAQRFGDQVFKDLGIRVILSDVHNTCVDRLLEVFDVRVRVQEKSSHPISNQVGLAVNMFKKGGLRDSRISVQPYSAGDLDALVVYLPESHPLRDRHLYVIPADALRSRGILQHGSSSRGKHNFLVYPPGSACSTRRPRDEWANEYLVDVRCAEAARSKVLRALGAQSGADARARSD
jgi:hypothetical protein